jgi:DNA-binding LacI/PurR family transcriptional regulator
MSPTMSDVARKAGVSTATVSRVLSGKPSQIPISEKTKEIVLRTAQNLGYELDPIARALRTGRSNIIGVVVRDTEDPFFAIIIKSIAQTARKFGYDMMLGSFDLDVDHHHTFQRAFKSGLYDGIIVIGHLPGDERIVSDIAKGNKCTVGITRLSAHDPFPCIGFDNEKAATIAMQYLRDIGHARIAFIGTDQLPALKQRRQIFLAMMKRDGLSIPEDFIQLGNKPDADTGYILMKKLMDATEKPSAILVGNDLMAIVALHAADEKGVSVPEEISVIGFDDINYARFVCPPLTTIRFPARELGEQAVSVLMNLISNGEIGSGTTAMVLEPKLVVRKSTTPLKK